jgi:phosphate-selective porin OprO/OprP
VKPTWSIYRGPAAIAASSLSGIFLGFALLAPITTLAAQADSAAVRAESIAAQADSVAVVESEGDLPPPPPRLLSQSELELELETLRRELEELNVRIGSGEPSEQQKQQMQNLETRIAELERAVAVAQESTEETAEVEGGSLKGRWLRLRDALRGITRYDVKDGMFRLRLGLRFQLDATLSTESDELQAQVGEIENSIDFRRFRIFARGRFLRSFDFEVEYDFAADEGLKDAYIGGVRFTKYVGWRLGHFKEPFSLARQTSAYNLGFLEWALPSQAFSPGRNLGLMLRHTEANKRLFWAASVTTNGKITDDNRGSADLSFAARVTGLPLYRDKGRQLLHVGASYTLRDPKSGDSRFSARPEARFAPFFADTGRFSSERGSAVALEAAAVIGPVWLQSEWITAAATSEAAGDPRFYGFYFEAGWFLTGESRFYQPEDAVFGRLIPHRLFRGGNPFRRGADGGALEFVGRVSTIDLNGGLISGGEMTDVSLGVNWYLSHSSRFDFNYVHSYLRGVGRANLFLFRYQYNP